MSYAAIQVPDAQSLLSQIKDIRISTDEKLNIDILVGDDVVLAETYVADPDGVVEVSELDRVLESYVYGAGMDATEHPDLVKTVIVKVNDVVLCTFDVMYFKAYTLVDASAIFTGKVILHLMKQKKWVSTISEEYCSVSFTESGKKLQVFITHLVDGVPTNSDTVDLYTSSGKEVKTVDVSFPVIAALFDSIDPDSIIAIRLKTEQEITVLMVDRNSYVMPLQFRYINAFGVPDTLITRGQAVRKGNTSFDTSTIQRKEVKFNVQKADTFTISSGKVYAFSEYDRYREMFMSETVEVLFMEKWRKVIIEKESMDLVLRTGSLNGFTFDFRFADKRDNNIITGESFFRWILEHGVWEDSKMWIDTGEWIDLP